MLPSKHYMNMSFQAVWRMPRGLLSHYHAAFPHYALQLEHPSRGGGSYTIVDDIVIRSQTQRGRKAQGG